TNRSLSEFTLTDTPELYTLSLHDALPICRNLVIPTPGFVTVHQFVDSVLHTAYQVQAERPHGEAGGPALVSIQMHGFPGALQVNQAGVWSIIVNRLGSFD